MGALIDLLNKAGPLEWTILIIVLVCLGLFAASKFIPRREKPTISDKKDTTLEVEVTEEIEVKSILGTGNYKCVAFRPGNIIDFTTMPEPIGEEYMVDTSLPVSGGHYIVRELEDGQVVDYDPRMIPVIAEETPEFAWFCVNWDDVRSVYAVAREWWKSASTWYVVGMLAIVFIGTMLIFGG